MVVPMTLDVSNSIRKWDLLPLLMVGEILLEEFLKSLNLS